MARYELLFRRQRKAKYKAMLTQTNIVFAYLNAMLDIKIAETCNPSQIKAKLAKSGEIYYQERLKTELTKLETV